MPRIAISQYQFSISDPFESGISKTEIEANVLNYHRADLIRRIAVKWVNAAEAEAPDGVLTIDQLDEITKRVRDLDSSYELAPKPPPRESAFEQELKLVAYETLRREGPIPPAEFSLRLEEMMTRPNIRERARELLVSSLNATSIGDFL